MLLLFQKKMKQNENSYPGNRTSSWPLPSLFLRCLFFSIIRDRQYKHDTFVTRLAKDGRLCNTYGMEALYELLNQ